LRVSGAFLSLLSALVLAAPGGGATGRQLFEQELANGVRLIVMRDSAAPMVAARALWAGGLRSEPVEVAGIRQVLAEAWMGGCAALDPAELARRLRDDGASMGGVVGRETLGLRAEWTRAGWEPGFELLADCIAHPVFAAHAVRRARERTAALMAQRWRSPAWAARDLVDGALRDPGRPSLSPRAIMGSLERLDRRQVLAHYRLHYPISAMTLAVVGDVDPALVLARAQARFGSAPRLRAATPRPIAEPARPERELYRHLAGKDAAVAIGFPTVGRRHRDRAALEVAAALLGRGAVRAGLVTEAETGFFALHTVCRPEELPEALSELQRQTRRLSEPGASEHDVRRAALRLARAREDALARSPQAAALLALYEVLGPGAQHAASHAALLRAVRAADVRAAAARHLREDAAVVATAMPLLATPEAARRMRGVVRRPAKGSRR
jgi:zinc protease